VGSVIGPVTLTRGTGAPVISTFEFPGDPSAGYILDIRDNGSRGLTGSVALNGDEVGTTNDVGGTAGFHIRRAVTVRLQNTLQVRLEGKPGATMTLELRSGVSMVGPAGGSLRIPGGVVTLNVPPGALAAPTELSITRAGAPSTSNPLGSWDLAPSGTQFSVPATLSIVVDPAVVAAVGKGPHPMIMTQTLPTDTMWTIVAGTTYDAAAGRVTAPLTHFSKYTEIVFGRADLGCARIIQKDAIFLGPLPCSEPPFPPSGSFTRDTVDVPEGGGAQTAYLVDVHHDGGATSLWVLGNMGSCENIIVALWPECIAGLTTTSNDPSIAYRDATGLVHGVRVGETVINAVFADGSVLGASLIRVHPGTHLFSFSSNANADAGVGVGALFGGATLVGGRLAVDGTSGFVQVGSRLVPASGSLSVMLFAREAAAKATYVEFISQGLSGSGFYVGHTPTGMIRVSDAWQDTGIPMPADNLEHHYAVTFDAVTNLISLYVDGQLKANRIAPIARGIAGGNDTRFGKQFDPFTEQLGGTVDNVSIYPSALSATEVQTLSRRSADLPCTAEGTVFSGAGTPSQLVFENQTGEAVRIEWLNSVGLRVLYVPSLANGNSYTQGTFLTHPWIVTGLTSGKCYGIWRSVSTGRIVTVN
jgi:hypothetical protein